MTVLTSVSVLPVPGVNVPGLGAPFVVAGVYVPVLHVYTSTVPSGRVTLAEVRRFVPGGTSKKTHGTGFGLPIAKRKIEDHGGSLAIESKEDAGTTIVITLPIEAGDSSE